MSEAAARGRALAAGIILAVLLFWPALAGGRVFAFRDLADYAIPHKLYAAAELRSGHVPLWNPWDFCGFPHLANLQSGVLYPPNLLLLLRFPWGFNLSLVLHFLIAGMGAYELGRRLGAAPLAAGVAGLGYGFSPYLLSLTDLNAMLFTSSWLPWLVVGGEALGREPRPRRMALAAIVFAAAFLAGEPQTLALGAGLAAVVSIASSPHSARALVRLALAWLLAATVTLLLVAPVLLPFLELAGLSERSGAGLTREEVYQYSLEPRGLATLIFPGFAGDIVTGTHWLGAQTYVRNPYLGVLVLALAIAGALVPGRLRLALVAAAVGGTLLALGRYGLLYPMLYAMGFRQSRFPVKFEIVTVLALAVLAARGAGALAAPDSGRARRRVMAVLAGAAIVALAVALAVRPEPGRAAAWRTLLVAMAGILLLFLWGRRATSRWPPWLGLALMASDLCGSAPAVLTTMPAEDLLRPADNFAVMKLDDANGWPRVYTPPISAEMLRRVYREGRFDASALERKKALLFGNTNLLFRIPVVRGGESMQVRSTSELLALVDRGPVAKRLLDLTGAGWFLTAGEDGQAVATANPAALPHAFLVGRAGVAVDGAALARLEAPDFDPARDATVDRDPGRLDQTCPGGRARIVRSSATGIAIDVDSPARCLLVLTDTHYPGWEASVDGAHTSILRADHAFRGVVLEPGRHSVEFHYRPRSFARGVKLAAAGAALLLALVLFPVRRFR